MDLQDLRSQIDGVDDQILDLLNQRAKVVLAVAKAKGGGVKFSPAREAQIIERLTAANSGPFTDESLIAVYREIIACCLGLEQQMRIAYLGPKGTYSEEAARKRFGVSAELIPAATLDDVLKAAERHEAEVAVLPVENSTEGAVNRTLDLLLETQLQVLGEVSLPIHHQLLSKAKNMTDIKTIAAHPQSFGQCHDWLYKHLPHAMQVAMNSNAQAAQEAAKHPDIAAIAGTSASEEYNLPILAGGIEDDHTNTTRFMLLGHESAAPSGNDKTSLICSVPNRPGELGKLIAVLSKANINITRLDSRPSSTGLWDYVFYIDIDGHADDTHIAKALAELQESTLFLKVIGSYPKDAI